MNKLTSILSHRFTPYILLGIGIIYVSIEANRMGDFFLFLKAAERMGERGDIYSTTYVSGFHYYYSPFFAWLLLPFVHLPFYIPKLIWLLLNLFFIHRIYKIVPEYLNLSIFSAHQRTAFWLLSTVLIARFFLINIHVIQMTIFLVYALLEGIQLIDHKKEIKGSMLLAVAINIKIMPIVIIPWLLYRNLFKASAYIVLFSVLYLLIPAIKLGWSYNMELHTAWWQLINPSHKEHLIDIDEAELHSITTWLPTLLIENARCGADLTLKRNIANLPVETVVWIIQVVRVVLLAMVFYFLRSLPFRKVQSRLQQWWELSYILLITPLIFPHQQFYAFLFMLPAFFYLAYFFVLRGNKDKMLILALGIIFILTSFIGGTLGFLRDISSHYKLITYGSFITVGLLAYYRPSLIEEHQYTLNTAE
ncbi:MAG TPA: glycosyltransferase 87 family protein [Bacteroidia bacterium]|nr:glycosyltransferase 87 family protein [Bacteroidia bacterium]